MYTPKAKNGFTLVELLLYTAIVGVIIGSISVLLTMVLRTRVKSQTIAEVEQSGVQVMQLITQTIRNAEGITAPAQGSSASSLTLDIYTVPQDPTVFDVLSGTLRITEGGGSAVPLTSSRVTVSGVTFTNVSHDGTPGTVEVQFTLTHINPQNVNEYDYSKTFMNSASLR